MPAYAYADMFGEGMVVVSIKCLLTGLKPFAYVYTYAPLDITAT